MKIFTLITLLMCSLIANALGPEAQEFVGETKSGIIILEFKADPNLYGSKINQLSNCYLTRESIACSSDVNKESITKYKLGNSKSKYFSPAQKLFHQLYPGMKIGTWNSNGVYNNDFYVCMEGCSTTVPKFFILITHGD